MKTADFKTFALVVINLVSHIPFLFAGYGREEDAWAQALNAKIISTTGIYEVSRLPGHPVYEIMLSLLWPLNHSYFLFNLLTTIASTAAIVYFYKICRKLNLNQAFPLAVTLSFIPVFFIAGTYTIDYNFALLFILLSFYQLLNKRLIWAGILLGIACGFRISSLFLIVPWLIMIPGTFNFKNWLILGFSAGITSLICFLPPILTYGMEFLDFHKPPYASWASIVFKLTFGIWGSLLLIYLFATIFQRIFTKEKLNWDFPHLQNFKWGLLLIVALQLFVFFRLPFKSEFLIPALPFILIAMSRILTKRQVKTLPFIAILSCFLMGFDYKNEYRGSPPSPVHYTFEAGGKDIFLDILQGPVIIDHGKRLAKYNLITSVKKWMEEQTQKSYLVAGWYYPQIMVRTDSSLLVKPVYLPYKDEVLEAHQNGFKIFYLPEINEAIKLTRAHNATDSLGSLLLFE